MIKVAIADDHALFRTGVKTSLQNKYNDIEVVAEAENGKQLLDLLNHIQPDIVLLDIQMPIMDGLTTLTEIKRLYPGIKVIFLSMHNDHSIVSKMMEIGANSYLTKEAGSAMIYEAIKGVYENSYHYNELTNQALLKGLRTKRASESSMPLDVQLTDKEMTILKLICVEKSTQDIADIVDLSPRTVEAIRDKLKTKTGTKSMAGLVMYAVKAGLLEEKMDNAILSITKDQLTQLYKISNSILSYVNHDLAGQRSIIHNTLDQLKEEILNVDKEEIDKTEAIGLIDRALEATGSVSSINKLIKSYANFNKSDDPARLFITWPVRIVESIKDRNKNAVIKVEDSLLSLRIVYPNVILFSILSELTENAKKNTADDLNISIKWNMKGKTFQCEIHDNGPGFKGLNEKQLTPMQALNLDKVGMGLKIIERTILDSGGHIFFSKSELLKGAKVYFEFPVIEFTT